MCGKNQRHETANGFMPHVFDGLGPNSIPYVEKMRSTFGYHADPENLTGRYLHPYGIPTLPADNEPMHLGNITHVASMVATSLIG